MIPEGRFRKKPIVINAVLVSRAIDKRSKGYLPEWLVGAYENGTVRFRSDHVEIDTLEGRMTGELTDYLIQGVRGEIYPCKAEIFEATYEEVLV